MRDQGDAEPCGNECKNGAVIVSGQRRYGSHMAACELQRGVVLLVRSFGRTTV